MLKDDASVLQVMRTLWAKYLSIYDVEMHKNFFEAGGDDLLFKGLKQSVQNYFNISIQHVKKNDFTTLYQQEKLIKKKLNIPPQNNIIVNLQEGDANIDLPIVIAVHPIAGTLFSYMRLFREMKAKNKIIGVQDCIFSGDLRQFNSIADQASFYINELKKKIHAGQHIILMGYSAGGIIANEMAYQLHNINYTHIEHIIMFDSWVRMPFDLQLRKSLISILERNFDKNKPQVYLKTQMALNIWLHNIIWRRMSLFYMNEIKPLNIETTVFAASEGVAEYKVEKSMIEDWVNYAPKVSIHKAAGNHENMLDDMDLAPVIAILDPILNKEL